MVFSFCNLTSLPLRTCTFLLFEAFLSRAQHVCSRLAQVYLAYSRTHNAEIALKIVNLDEASCNLVLAYNAAGKNRWSGARIPPTHNQAKAANMFCIPVVPA